MGSATQIGAGVLILAAAFIFGHYVHQNSENQQTDLIAPEDDLEWQSQQQIEDLRRRIETSGPIERKEKKLPPQSSMPIAGLGRKPVIRKPAALPVPIDQPETSAQNLPTSPTVLAELPPLQSTDSFAEDSKESISQKDILQPDFSVLKSSEDVAIEKSKRLDSQTETAIARENSQTSARIDGLDYPAPQFGNRLEVKQPKADDKTSPTNRNPNHSVSQLASIEKPNLKPIGNSKKVKVEARRYLKYTTRYQDSLQDISTRYFGKPDYYLDIYIANRKKLSSPVNVPANIELRIPVYNEAP